MKEGDPLQKPPLSDFIKFVYIQETPDEKRNFPFPSGRSRSGSRPCLRADKR
jgi:hypothetical protein